MTRDAAARILAALPRPPLAPYPIGEPVVVRVHRSSWNVGERGGRKGRRKITPAARANIRAAQRRRWAKHRAAQAANTKKERTACPT